MTADERNQRRYAPFVDTLRAFAARHGLEITYDAGHHPSGDPHYEVRWMNTCSQTCVLYFNWLREDQFLVHVFCWPPEALEGPPEQRWSPRAASGLRKWHLADDEDASASLGSILDEAKTWADEVKGPGSGSDAEHRASP